MKILNTDFFIRKDRSDAFHTSMFTNPSDMQEITADDVECHSICCKIYGILMKRNEDYTSKFDRIYVLSDTCNITPLKEALDNVEIDTSVNESSEKTTTVDKSELIKNLISFFSEFQFEPNFRFINTLGRQKNKIAYVHSYFELADSQYLNEINDKMKSDEFKTIVSMLNECNITSTINKRFKLYYGSQGTGKTTIAMKEACNNVVVCHSAMLPSDLMEDFNFKDGKAEFNPSALCRAMTEGKAIVLDEINLLPFESLRFLQSILDNKSEIVYKGHVIEIKDGFQIIGTMNLHVNGCVYALPEPLIDRASELRKFTLTAKDLLSALN